MDIQTTEQIACMGFDALRILQGMEPKTYTADQICAALRPSAALGRAVAPSDAAGVDSHEVHMLKLELQHLRNALMMKETFGTDGLPDLPNCAMQYGSLFSGARAEYFSAKQMRMYGAACVKAASGSAQPAGEPFAWIIARNSDGEWDGGEPMMDKGEADDYMVSSCLPGWHLEPIYRATPAATVTAAEASEDARDAARYRWLRGKREITLLTAFFGNGCVNRHIAEVDTAIDAAIKAMAPGAKP